MTNEDLQQADLAELFRTLGMYDGARPQSPHEGFQEALGVLRTIMSGTESDAADNDYLRFIGAFDRKMVVNKHAATHQIHLRDTVRTLDEAGLPEAADTLIWQAWHLVNSRLRHAEFYKIVYARAEDAERAYGLMCEEDRRLKREASPVVEALRCTVAALEDNEIDELHRNDGCHVFTDALRDVVKRADEALA